MSLSDCEKCWETPCVCGYNYLSWEPERIQELIDVLEVTKKLKDGWIPTSYELPERGKEIVGLDSDEKEHHIFRGHVGGENWQSIFGGQLLVDIKYWKYKFDKDKEE